MKIIKAPSKRESWVQSRRLRRFIYLMSPDGQLSSHPVMGMLWILALGCAAGGIILALWGRRGWSPLLVCAVILIFNMVLGSIGQILFEEFLGKRADLGSTGYGPGGPGHPDIPPDGTNPIQPDARQRKTEVKLPCREGDRQDLQQREPDRGQTLKVMEEMVVVSVSSQMLVAFVQKWPRTHASSHRTGAGQGSTCATLPRREK